MKKIVSSIMLALILISTLSVAFNVKPAKAEWIGTVHIRADGSIDPQDAPILTYDKVTYTLTDDIKSDSYGIIIEKDNIILDGAGYTVDNAGEPEYPYTGIYLYNRHDIKIRHIQVRGFYYGIVLSYSSNNIIIENSITNNVLGIYPYYSPNNRINGNYLINNSHGVYLEYSSNTELSSNIFVNDGLYVFNSTNNIVVDNVVNGKPLVYLEGASNVVVTDAGQVILVNCSRITVENLNLSNTCVGIELRNTDNSIISRNNLTNNYYGVVLAYSSNNIISRNKVTNNVWGVGLVRSLDNIINGNNITNNYYCGVCTRSSYYNKFFHNNLASNEQQVNDIPLGYPYVSPSINVWDDDYPSGGNYWSDYTGVDFYSGPDQDQPGSDGIGDTPYIIDENNRDRYPLMKPWTPIPSLTPVADFSYNPVNPKVDEKVNFDASASYDPDGQIVLFRWNFGDGSTGEGKMLTHSYAKEGNYKVTLTVLDNDGKSSSISKTVTVVKPTPAANILKILDKYYNILDQSTGWTQSGSFYYLNYEPDGKRLPRSSKTISGFTTVDDGDIYPSQCVDFVRVLSNTIYIKTKDWRQGPNVMTSTDIEPGTVVATFKDGKYPANGTRHVAVFAGFIYSDGRRIGFRVFDQNWRTDGGLGVVGKHPIYQTGTDVTDADNYYIVTLEGISIKATCPVDLEVIDPDSLKINKELSEIPEAIYIEEDLNGDGSLDDHVFIPEQKIGEYLIRVIPEPNANPTATYTLEVSSEDTTLILAENVPICDIPTEPYIITSVTFKALHAISLEFDFDPDTLNLGSKGKWITAYIELSEGFDVANINVSTILLNGSVPVDFNAPIAVGDYDNDSIPDLMVKFNRADVISYILDNVDLAEIYENRFMTVTLTITGKLNDGTPFQGSCTIKIILPMPRYGRFIQYT